MNILVFNWRDIKNPSAGGAEKYIHEIFKRLSNKSNKITLLTSAFKGCRKKEIIDGIKVIRIGGRYSVYLKARKYYQKYLSKNNYDLIIDSINTIPFFTPDFIKDKNIISIIYQLAREFWFYETKFPINLVGYHLLENWWLKRYTNIPVITISDSTKEDLASLGFKSIYIVPIGLSVEPLEKLKARNKDILLFIGRLTKAKKPFDIIKAFSLVAGKFPDSELLIMGRGYLEQRLRKYCKVLGCDSKVKFLGFLSEEDKTKIIRKAKLLLVAGVREGWGMTVTEANASGIPAIGYNIPGIRDAIIDGKTGLLSDPNPILMAEKIIEVLECPNLYNRLTINALEYSKRFSWDVSAKKFNELIVNYLF